LLYSSSNENLRIEGGRGLKGDKDESAPNEKDSMDKEIAWITIMVNRYTFL